LDPDYCMDSGFRGANDRVGPERCRKDLFLSSGFLLLVGIDLDYFVDSCFRNANERGWD
jgi:hypothetical protein